MPESYNVLFVDDETDFLDTLIKRMSKRKINVTGVKSGEAAVDFIKNMPTDQPIDVVVLDVRMPGMDGIQTLKEIKKIAPELEVIMLTGHANLEVAKEGMENGAFDYMMKPADMDDLLLKIQDAYKKKNLRGKKTKA
ncbi:response regulator [Desulforegula conservatrix]|uniref:response regulator n=1 Tax=Desulforegula conservatrix TaxID=153026 RepID=UPI00042657C3|nr:response regulator [Desulforegula conservatrix]